MGFAPGVCRRPRRACRRWARLGRMGLVSRRLLSLPGAPLISAVLHSRMMPVYPFTVAVEQGGQRVGAWKLGGRDDGRPRLRLRFAERRSPVAAGPRATRA